MDLSGQKAGIRNNFHMVTILGEDVGPQMNLA